jgi:hypothetical protein
MFVTANIDFRWTFIGQHYDAMLLIAKNKASPALQRMPK